jgi:hypothetical protein
MVASGVWQLAHRSASAGRELLAFGEPGGLFLTNLFPLFCKIRIPPTLFA